jgi:hypothetical protein
MVGSVVQFGGGGEYILDKLLAACTSITSVNLH